MGYLLKSLVAAAKVPLYLDFRTGSLKDLGGMGNHPTTLTSLKYANDRGNAICVADSASQLTCPSAASLRISSLSIACVLNLRAIYTSPGGRPLVVQRGALDYYDFRLLNGGTWQLWSGASSANFIPAIATGWKSVGVTWAGGGIPRMYLDASVAGNFSGIVTANGSGVAGLLGVGCYAGLVGYQFVNPIRALTIVNEMLDDAEMTRLMRELEASPTVVRRPTKGFSLPYPAKTAAQYAAESIICDVSGERPPVDLVTGTSPTHATNRDHMDQQGGGPFTKAMRGDGNAWLGFPSTVCNLPAVQTDWTLEFWTTLNTIAGGRYVAKAFAGAPYWYVEKNVGNIRLSLSDSGAINVLLSAIAPVKGKTAWFHVMYTYDAGGYVRVYFDGVLAAAPVSVAAQLGHFSNADAFVINNDASQTVPTDNAFAMVRMRTVALTAQEVRARYLEEARKLLLDAGLHRDGSCPVTVVALTPSDVFSNGWTIGVNSWSVTEVSPSGMQPGERYFTNVGAGHAYFPAFGPISGSWYFKTSSSPSGGNFYITLTSSKEALTDASQYGYSILHTTAYMSVNRVDAGVSTNIGSFGYASASQYTQEHFVTRDANGVFRFWLKDGVNYPDWAYVGTCTSTTYSDIRYLGIHHAWAGCRFYKAKHWLGAMDPYEAIALGLIAGEVPDPITFTTADTTQSWTATVNTGKVYVFDWGDGTTTWMRGTGVSQAITHTYAGAGTYTIKLYVADPTSITALNGGNNGLMGSVPDVSTWTALRSFYLDYNLLTGTLPSFAANTELRFFAVTANDIAGPLPDFSACVNLITFYIAGNLFTGSLPSFAACTALQYFNCGNNLFTGALPAFAGTAMLEFDCYSNNFSGSIPSFAAHTGLTRFLGYDNQFSGNIPDFAPCTALVNFRVYDNQLTGRVAGTVATTCTTWRADTNALTQAAVDGVLADFVTNLAGRPAAGTINLALGTNSAPSAAGLASKAAILAAKPAWTITHT